MCARLTKKNVIKYIGWMSFNVTMYVYILNQVIHHRRTKRDWCLHTFTFINKSYCQVNYTAMLTIFFALYLGGWWAAQEGSWGGWWNWDSSEFFGLLILFICLIPYHVHSNITSKTFFYLCLYLSIFIVILFFIELQLNFATSAHNFGFQVKRFRNLSLSWQILLVTGWGCYFCGLISMLKTRYYFYIKATCYIKIRYMWFIFFYTLVLLYNVLLLNTLLSLAPSLNMTHAQQMAQVGAYSFLIVLLLLCLHINYNFSWLYCNYVSLFKYLSLTTKQKARKCTTYTPHMLITSAIFINFFFQETTLVYLDTAPNIYHRTYVNYVSQQLVGIEYNPLIITKATSCNTKFLTLVSTTKQFTITHIFSVWLPKLQATTFDFLVSLLNLIIPFIFYYFVNLHFKRVII